MKEELKKLLEMAGVIYGKEITDTLIGFYVIILEEFKTEEINKAFFKHFQTCRFFPTPADIAVLIKPSLLHQKNEFGY